MDEKNNIISLTSFREKKQSLTQKKRKAYNESVSAGGSDPAYHKKGQIIPFETGIKRYSLTAKSTQEQTSAPKKLFNLSSYLPKNKKNQTNPPVKPSNLINMDTYRENKHQNRIFSWQSVTKQAINVAGVTAVMLFALNIFIPQKHEFSAQQRGLASQTPAHSQTLGSTEFVKKLNKTFKNQPAPLLERDLDSVSFPKKVRSAFFLKGISPETPNYKGF